MVKSIIKEIFIFLLLIVSIMVLLAVLLYDYNPVNKKPPVATYSYELQKTAEEELQETIEAAQTQNIIKTYTVDSNDLAAFARTKDYDKGRENPFDPINIEKNRSQNTNTSAETANGETTNTEAPSGGSPQGASQGSFFNEVK